MIPTVSNGFLIAFGLSESEDIVEISHFVCKGFINDALRSILMSPSDTPCLIASWISLAYHRENSCFKK